MEEIKFRLFGKNSKEFLGEKPYGLTLKELQNVADLDAWHKQQFTGLEDANGVEIYEGDIIGSQKTIGEGRCATHHVVSWHDTGLKAKQIGTYGAYIGIAFYTQNMGSPYVVVGNIYENPELLGANHGKD